MKKQWLILLLLFLIVPNVSSSASEIPILKKGIIKSNERIEYAKQLQFFLTNEIFNKIPNQSPSQMEWIRNEQKIYNETQNEQRFNKALETDEFKFHILREFTEDILSNFDGILQQDSLEFYHWTRLSSGLLNPTIWLIILEMTQKDYINKAVFNNKSNDLFQYYINNGVSISKGILNNIVLLNLFIGQK